MEGQLQYNAEKLERLLQLWVDCPTQVRSTLSPSIAKFSELSNEAAKYEEVRYPFIFFQQLCDAAALALERGETLDDRSTSSLLTAWTSVQLSIQLTNDPRLHEELHTALYTALLDTAHLLVTFLEHRIEQEDNPQEWKLVLDIQKSSCEGALATLAMLYRSCSKESLALKLQDLDKKTQSLAREVMHLRQTAIS